MQARSSAGSDATRKKFLHILNAVLRAAACGGHPRPAEPREHMAFAIDPDNPDHNNYKVTDANDQVVTSSARQDQLARAGFLFEACVAQSAMIEALCVHYLMLLKKATGKTIQPNLQQ